MTKKLKELARTVQDSKPSDKVVTALTAFKEEVKAQGQKYKEGYDKLCSAVDTLGSNLSKAFELDRKHVDKHLETLETTQEEIKSNIDTFSATIPRCLESFGVHLNSNTRNISKTKQAMDELTFRALHPLFADVRKGERSQSSSRQQLSEREKMAQRYAIPAKTPPTHLAHDWKSQNPYDLPLIVIQGTYVQQDPRFQAYLELLPQPHKDWYEVLSEKRVKATTETKQRAYEAKFGKKPHNMPYQKFCDLVSQVNVEPLEPIWIYSFPHTRGHPISLEMPFPAPWGPALNTDEYDKKERLRMAQEEKKKEIEEEEKKKKELEKKKKEEDKTQKR